MVVPLYWERTLPWNLNYLIIMSEHLFLFLDSQTKLGFVYNLSPYSTVFSKLGQIRRLGPMLVPESCLELCRQKRIPVMWTEKISVALKMMSKHEKSALESIMIHYPKVHFAWDTHSHRNICATILLWIPWTPKGEGFIFQSSCVFYVQTSILEITTLWKKWNGKALSILIPRSCPHDYQT